MAKEFKDNKESEKENNTLVNSNMTDNFTHLFNLLNKKDYPKLRIKIDEVLNLNIDNLSTKIYAKLIEIFLNLEENKLPSFVLLAPFGEVCENIKKLFTDCNQGSGESKNIKEDELKEFMRFGSELYKKFHDNLLSLNEDNLINILNKYEYIFINFKVQEDKKYVNSNIPVSKRVKEYVDEVTLANQFTNNKKRKRIFKGALSFIIILGLVAIYMNETFGFRKVKKPDFISLEDIDYKVNLDKGVTEKIEKKVTLNENKEVEEVNGKNLDKNVNKRKNENIFSIGMYEIIKSAPVRIAPKKDSKVIGKFNIGNRIKVVGKEGKYYKIASKDDKHFGYVPLSHCRFIISDK